MIEFDLGDHEYIELHSLLKATALCESGGIAKLLIADGLVQVDGATELRKRCKIRAGQVVTYDKHQVRVR